MKKALFGFLLTFGLFTVVNNVTWDEYCFTDQKNTPCATNCIMHSRCGGNPYTPLTNKERNYVVELHNECRNKVALGQEPKLPACTGGMKAISYDMEMEFLAACHAKQCIFDHDEVRLNAAGERAGQNLYIKRPISNNMVAIHRGVLGWYDEVNLIKDEGPKLVAGYNSKMVPGSGHLTQMLWGNTSLVGCAIMRYPTKNGLSNQLTCDYFPGGNIRTLPIYVDGTCTPNSKYSGLCGEITNPSASEYQPPPDVSNAPRTMAPFPSFIGNVAIILLINIMSMSVRGLF